MRVPTLIKVDIRSVPTTTTFAKRQVPSSFAGVDDGAVSSSIAAVDNGVSSSFADDGTVYTSYAGDDEGCIFRSVDDLGAHLHPGAPS